MGEGDLARTAAAPQELRRRPWQSWPDEGTLRGLREPGAGIDRAKLLSLLFGKGREEPASFLYERGLPDARRTEEERGMTAREGDFERPPGGVVVPAPEMLQERRRRPLQGSLQEGEGWRLSKLGGVMRRKSRRRSPRSSVSCRKRAMSLSESFHGRCPCKIWKRSTLDRAAGCGGRSIDLT